MKKHTMTFLVGLTVLAVSVPMPVRVLAEQPSHIDRSKIPETCSACHKSHGRRGTPSLRATVPDLCFNCHSPYAGGRYASSPDVYFAFNKKYNHPVIDTSYKHIKDERLPEESPTAARHVSCLDCHDPHLSKGTNPIEKVPGISAFGTKPMKAKKVSDVCYKCHGDSDNKPFGSPNTRQEFDTANVSYHPIERVGKRQSISLNPDLRGGKIECVDCHDPHGSDYMYMLRYNYSDIEGGESNYAYELCYNCHNRSSILADQSFSQHKKHIVFGRITCNGCHNAHSSENNDRLIKFDEKIVQPNQSGLLQYVRTGKLNNCYLSCHNVVHNGTTIEK